MVADALVGADALADHLDVGAEPLGQARDLVHEADLGREHAVGGVFRQLRRAHVHDDDLVAAAVEGLVDLAQQILGRGVGGADDDAVGAHAVRDRRALLEEFGVRDHVEAEIAAFAAAERLHDPRPHLVGGADGDGGFGHDHLGLFHVAGDGSGDAQHVLQVGRAVLVGRRPHGDELDAPVRHAAGGVGGEAQPAPGMVLAHQILEARLEDRDASGLERRHLLRVDVDAEHVMPDLRQHGALDEADIAGSEYGDLHRWTSVPL